MEWNLTINYEATTLHASGSETVESWAPPGGGAPPVNVPEDTFLIPNESVEIYGVPGQRRYTQIATPLGWDWG